MKFLLFILRGIAGLANLLPYRWSNKIIGLCDALSAPLKLMVGKEARQEAKELDEEVNKAILVAQAKRAEAVKK